MSRLDFLYRTELPHRVIAVYSDNRAAIPQERRQKQFAVPVEKVIKKTACRRSAFNHGCNDSFKAVLFYIPKHIE